MTASTALRTDRYELTMLDAALRDGTAHRRCVFELFSRRLSAGRRFGVVAGTGRLLSLIRDFRFGDDELRFLRDERVVDAETLTLSVLNHDSAVATAAARMSIAAGDRPLAEMGSRRAGEDSAVAAARAAFIAGFGATSNLEAGRRWGIPTMGTAAHAWTLLHDTEEQAFRSQIEALGADTTLLVDTYDTTR